MDRAKLYRGVWPQNVSKLAKYSVRLVDGIWKVTVLYEAEVGLRYLAVEGGDSGLAEKINSLKMALGHSPGGPFYVNEFRHVIFPVAAPPSEGTGSLYYYAGRLEEDFVFEFEGKPLNTRPIGPDGNPLEPGERWIGPRPGIPYVLAAGGGDIYYESPALTDEEAPRVRPNVTRRVNLSRILHKSLLREAVVPIARIRGHLGGRFYVNEHGAMFTPVSAGDGNGIDYIYCGLVNYDAWFPEPPTE